MLAVPAPRSSNYVGAKWWNCGELNSSAEGICKEIYMCSELFCLNQKILKRAKYFLIDSLCFGKKSRKSLSYPDNIMPQPIYRKSMSETPAEPIRRKLERKRNLSYRSMEML